MVCPDSSVPPADAGPQPFLAEFQSASVVYSRALPATGTLTTQSLATSASGAIFLGGEFTGSIDFGLDGGPVQAPSTGGAQPLFFGQVPF